MSHTDAGLDVSQLSLCCLRASDLHVLAAVPIATGFQDKARRTLPCARQDSISLARHTARAGEPHRVSEPSEA